MITHRLHVSPSLTHSFTHSPTLTRSFTHPNSSTSSTKKESTEDEKNMLQLLMERKRQLAETKVINQQLEVDMRAIQERLAVQKEYLEALTSLDSSSTPGPMEEPKTSNEMLSMATLKERMSLLRDQVLAMKRSHDQVRPFDRRVEQLAFLQARKQTQAVENTD